MTQQRPAARTLVIIAHPDDVDFGAAGTVGTWTDAGTWVGYCVVTDGEAGGFDRSAGRSEMAQLRRKEQRAAAAVVGVDDVDFLRYPDGRVEASIDLRRDLSRVIRRTLPDRVVIQSPRRDWTRVAASHPDHLATAEAAIAAVYPDARNPFAFPELLEEGHEPHSVGEVWVMGGVGRPDRWIDITGTIDRKIAALLCHASQHPDPAGMEARVRRWNAAVAKSGGLPEGHHAEVFQAIDTR